MTTGRINQIAFVEKGAETHRTDATLESEAQAWGFRMLSDKVFSTSFRREATGRFQWWRTGLVSPLPFYRVQRSERSPSCVRCLRPHCEGRRSGPSRRLTVRLDTSDKGLGTALPFPGVARVPEAQTSQPGGRSFANRTERETSMRRVSSELLWLVAISL